MPVALQRRMFNPQLQNMPSIILQPEIKRKIEEIANKMLKPINGMVSISDDYSTVYCSTSWGNGFDRRDYKEYYYQIKIKSDMGEYKYSDIFDDRLDYNNEKVLARLAWNIAHNVWSRLDRRMDSELADNLWPVDNDYKPDNNKFLQ